MWTFSLLCILTSMWYLGLINDQCSDLVVLQFWLAFPWCQMAFRITFILVIYLFFKKCLFSSFVCLQILFLLCFYILDSNPFPGCRYYSFLTEFYCLPLPWGSYPKLNAWHWCPDNHAFFGGFILRNLNHFKWMVVVISPVYVLGVFVNVQFVWGMVYSGSLLSCVLVHWAFCSAVDVICLRSCLLPALFVWFPWVLCAS